MTEELEPEPSSVARRDDVSRRRVDATEGAGKMEHLELIFCGTFAIFLALHSAVLVGGLTFLAFYLVFRVIQSYQTRLLAPEGRAILITGCDSGIGLGLAQRLAERGVEVFAGCLDVNSDGATQLSKCSETKGKLHVIKLDVTSEENLTTCLHYVEHHTKDKGLWAVVNNAGVMCFGELELTPMEDYRHSMEVNVFGTVQVSKTFLPLLRQVKGRVVNVTSVRGLLPFPENSAYVISKFAGEALSDIMRMELSRFGVKVVIVEPGNFGGVTGIVNRELLRRRSRETSSELPAELLEAYGRHRLEDECEAAIRGRYSSYPNLDPVLTVMEKALLSSRPRSRYLIDGSNRFIDIDCMLARLRPFLPDTIMDYLTLKFFDLTPVQNPQVEEKMHCKLAD